MGIREDGEWRSFSPSRSHTLAHLPVPKLSDSLDFQRRLIQQHPGLTQAAAHTLSALCSVCRFRVLADYESGVGHDWCIE